LPVSRLGLFPFAAGALLLAAAWSPVAAALAPGPFAAHMARHLLVVAVAAPLLAVGFARAAPRFAARAAELCPPVAASAVELVAVWAWHAPALHRAARQSGAALLAEQATFLTAGLLLWGTAFARLPDGRLARGPGGILALLLTATHMTLLGALIALSPRALFAHDGHDHLPTGAVPPPPVADQELGGVLMLAVGGTAYLAGGLLLLAELLRPPQRSAAG
jgi:putative membrane protein